MTDTILSPANCTAPEFEAFKANLQACITGLKEGEQSGFETHGANKTAMRQPDTGEYGAHEFSLTARHGAFGTEANIACQAYHGSLSGRLEIFIHVRATNGTEWSLNEPVRIDRANYICPEQPIATLVAFLERLHAMACAIDDDGKGNVVSNYSASRVTVRSEERLSMLLGSVGIEFLDDDWSAFLTPRNPYSTKGSQVTMFPRQHFTDILTEAGSQVIDHDQPMKADLAVGEKTPGRKIYTVSEAADEMIDIPPPPSSLKVLAFLRSLNIEGPYLNVSA